jgi:hypothetical protein
LPQNTVRFYRLYVRISKHRIQVLVAQRLFRLDLRLCQCAGRQYLYWQSKDISMIEDKNNLDDVLMIIISS